jgi:predicted cobalt transporter CbtA
VPEPRDVHRGATRVLSVVMVLIGVALVVSALARGGGPLATGVVFGLLLGGAGVARLVLERDRERGG